MQTWKRVLLYGVAAVLVIGILVLVSAYFFNHFIVDFWWFSSLGYDQYFWQRLLYRYAVFFVVALLFFIIFFLNFWIGSKYLGARTPSESKVNTGVRSRYQKLYERFQGRSLLVYFPLTLALAIFVALPLFAQWERTLLYFVAPGAGINDPVYGKDISYYLFSLPIYLLLLRELLVAFLIVLLGLILLYWLESRALSGANRHFRRGAKIHLNIVMLLVFLIGACYFILERHLLLYTNNHMPLFFGPGYVEMHVTLPLIWLCLLLLLAVAFSFIYFVNKRKGLIGFISITVFFFIALGVRYFSIAPDLMQRFLVRPNEMTLEAPYIANNILSTLAAYNLQDIETREYPIKQIPWDMTTPEVQMSLQNIPIWDEDGLHKAYEELQAIRTYYGFNSVDVGRYVVNDIYQQVFLSPREINFQELPTGAQNWINAWLKYTHGYGVVMNPASQATAGPMEWFIQGIPPDPHVGLETEEPAIYYGKGRYNPVIAPNDSREIDYSTGYVEKETDYKGEGGVKISSLFRKLIFALYFNEENIFYTAQTNQDSRLLFRRNITERISTLTPFLLLDPDPYAVVTPKRVYWIQDAYTYSSWYPYSRPYDGEFDYYNRRFNYIRNSVKIIVDAYDGSVSYYIADKDDPIIQAYARIYPDLFKDYEQMPDDLKLHVRYPKSVFDVQMDIYARYHQTDPELFYNQEDMWVFPEVQWRNDLRKISSYYLTLNLIDTDQFEFSLFVPMNPKGKNNMRALAVVGCDGDNYGRIVTYNFPKGTLVYGPPQVDAIVKQDPTITQQFTLWNQQGSRADRGRMVIIPIDGVMTYVQGVFLEATTGAKIPSLARLIVSQGQLAVMAPTLEEGFEALNERVRIELGQPAQQNLPPPDEAPEVIPEQTLER
jgi:uncharacterized membrane protein (UPF0182 family)